VPTSFTKSISKYADVKNPINISLAKSQHDQYVTVLRSRLPTLELPSLERFPDCVFVEDTVVAFRNRAVITNPGAESRKGEVDSIQAVLMQLGMELWNMREIDALASLDGGDVLNTGRHMFVGISDRTNQAGVTVLHEAFDSIDLPVIAVPMDATDALHLKSIVTHLDCHTLLVPEGRIGEKVLDAMKLNNAMGYEVLRLPDIRACNVVAVNNSLVMVSSSVCDSSKRILMENAKKRNLELQFVETAEIEKSDGGVTCCSVLLSL